jgi:hypothetical protein
VGFLPLFLCRTAHAQLAITRAASKPPFRQARSSLENKRKATFGVGEESGRTNLVANL